MDEAIKFRWFFLKKGDLSNTIYHLRGKDGEIFLTEQDAKNILRFKAEKIGKDLDGPFQFTTPAPK